MNDTLDALRSLSRKRFHLIWEMVKQGAELEGEDKLVGKLMLEHEEYHNTWEFADVIEDSEYTVDGVNPFLHITVHAIVENQIAQNDPQEVNETVERLKLKGYAHHGIVHRIGSVLIQEIFDILKQNRGFDEQSYVRKLRRIR